VLEGAGFLPLAETISGDRPEQRISTRELYAQYQQIFARDQKNLVDPPMARGVRIQKKFSAL